uniref:Serine/arginine-rich splicing factor 2 n=1 Tax=Schistocephalus solidus TaxID=70667 RepID=A0A183THS3_SCHSO
LRRVFGKYGHLLDVTVPVNFHTGRPKGFAFVEYPFYALIFLNLFERSKTDVMPKMQSIISTRLVCGVAKYLSSLPVELEKVSVFRFLRQDLFLFLYIISAEMDNLHAIQKQLEFYFSDANLSRDGFFKSELQNSADRSLSVNLLLNCNRLRLLGATAETVVAAAEHSNILDPVRNGSAIRRKTPINFTEARKECIVLATGLSPWPHDSSSLRGIESTLGTTHASPEDPGPGVDPVTNQIATVVDWLSEQLRRYGPVNYIKLPRFKSSGVVRGFAFIEFATQASAERAVTELGPTAADLASQGPISLDAGELDDSAAWTPKMAVNARMSTHDRLARQFVWRCCSRRSKQAIAAYHRLQAAGYLLPNPLEAECTSSFITAFSIFPTHSQPPKS